MELVVTDARRVGEHVYDVRDTAMQRLVCGCAAVMAGCQLIITASSLLGDTWAARHPAMWMLVTAELAVFVLCVLLAQGRLPAASAFVRFGALGLAGGAVVFASWLTWSDAPLVSLATARVLPVFTTQTLLILVVVFIPRWVLQFILGALVLAGYVALSLHDRTGTRLAVVDECLVMAAGLVSFGLLIGGLRRGARRAEAAADQQRSRRADEALATAAATAEEEARRVVHDQVIGALDVVAAGRDGADSSSAARTALAAIDGLDPTTSVQALQDALAQTRFPRVRQSSSGWLVAPPARVLTAMRQSVGEAIRNAHRHGGVDEVEVEFSATRARQAVVTVHDRGVGFDPQTQAGFGLSESIVARMSQVGGDASIRSRPGVGTTVQVTWPHVRQGSNLELVPGQTRTFRARFYVLVFLSFVVVSTFLAVVHRDEWTQPALPIAIALCWGVVILFNAWSTGRARPKWGLVVGGALFNAGAVALVWSDAPIANVLTPSSWVVWAAGGLIASLALSATFSQTVLLLAAHVAAIMVVAGVRDDLTPLQPIVPILMGLAMGALAYTAGASVRRICRELEVQEALLEALAIEPAWQNDARVASVRYAEQLRDDVAPFLQAVATQTGLPADAADKAGALAARCRDLLVRADPVPPAVREATFTARRSGVTVNLRHGHTSAEAWELLRVVLDSLPTADVITLIPAHGNQATRVVVIPAMHPAVAAAIGRRAVAASVSPHALGVERSDVSTTFSLVTPEWVTSMPDDNGIGSSS